MATRIRHQEFYCWEFDIKIHIIWWHIHASDKRDDPVLSNMKDIFEIGKRNQSRITFLLTRYDKIYLEVWLVCGICGVFYFVWWGVAGIVGLCLKNRRPYYISKILEILNTLIVMANVRGQFGIACQVHCGVLLWYIGVFLHAYAF